jgi:hypothetical protein
MDQQTLAVAAVAVVFIIVFGGFIWWVIRQKRRIREAFDTFSQAHRLEVQRGSFPTALGDVDGRFFSIGAKVHRTPSGRPQLQQVPDFWVQAGVQGDVPREMVAGKRGAMQGKGPVQTGDSEFDKKVWADCPNVEAARDFLTPERRRALIDVVALGATFVGPGDDNISMVYRKTRGYTPKLEWLEERFNEFMSVARSLDA